MQNRRTLLAAIGTVGTVAVAGCTGLLGDGAEDAVEQYFEAAAAGDTESQQEVVHDDALFVPIIEEEDEFNVSITTIERRTDREFLEEEDDDVSEEDIEELESEIDEFREEYDADDHALVYYEIEYEEEGEAEDGYVLLVEVDGDWLLISFT